jgi:hypothetical protein
VPRHHGGFFSGFPDGRWAAFHIDELTGDTNGLDVAGWGNRSLPEVMEPEVGLDIRKIMVEAVPKAASTAFKDNSEAATRIVITVEILTKCLAGGNQVRILFTLF